MIVEIQATEDTQQELPPKDTLNMNTKDTLNMI